MGLRKFCDHCKTEIIDYNDEVDIRVDLTKHYYFHKDCFNAKFNTNIEKLESEK